MARLIEARVIQKAGTIEELNDSDLKYYDGEQVFVKSDVDDNVISYKVGANGKKFNELPYPDFYAKGKVTPSSVFTGLPSGVYIPTLNGLYNSSVKVNLADGYQVLHWDGSTLQKVVYPIDFAGIQYGGIIDDTKDLSNPTGPILYIASAGTYNTVPPIILSETSILTWNGEQWSHIPFELEVRGDMLVADTISEIRNINSQIASLLINGTYKGVTVLGYYTKGDTPYSVDYYISNTSLPDDGGSVIAVSGIKLTLKNTDIDLKHFGGVSDGDETTFTGTNNKPFIDNAISYVSRIKGNLFINGKYYHDPLTINKSDFDITLGTGTKLISNLPDTQNKAITINGGANNININAYGAEVISPKTYSTGEFRHIFNITWASNINIFGVKATGGGGDGFYIGNDVENRLPYRVFLHDCIADGSRRNGISIINGETIYLYNPLCQNVSGTAPQAGIDIEPNSKYFEFLKDCKVINPTTKNCATYGVLVNVANYVNEIAKTVDISVLNHTSLGDGKGYAIEGKGGLNPWNNNLGGTINYSGNIFNPLTNGINIVAYDASKAPMLDIDAYIENAGSLPSSTSTEQNGLFIYAGGGSSFDVGNINAKIRVRDTRVTPKNYADVYLSNQNVAVVNYNIQVDSDNRRTFAYGVFNSSLQNAKGLISYYKKPIYNISTSQRVGNSVRGTGGIFNATSSLAVALPSCVGYEGNIYQVNCGINNAVVINASSGEYILLDGAKLSSVTLNVTGNYIEILATSTGWVVKSIYLNRSSSTANLPVVSSGVIYWYNSTTNKPVFWNGTSWIDLV